MPRLVKGPDGMMHSFPDDATDDEVRAALGGDTAPPAKQSSGWPAKLGEAAKGLASWLPAAGGMVGGYFGSIPGAAIGGAVGEGYKQLVQHGAELPGAISDVARNLLSHPVETASGAVAGTNRGGLNVGEEAATQAAGQYVGDKLAQGTGVMSKWLMNRATSRVSAKLMQDFPELSDTLIDNALTVSKGGLGKAHALLTEAKAQANAALKLADDTQRGIPVQFTPDLAESFKTALLEKAIKSGKMPPLDPGQPLAAASARISPEMRALFDNVDRAAAAGDVGHLKPTHADLLKTQLQKESRALYANRTAPNGPKAMGMDATERAELASRLNDAIGELAPGYRASNAEAKPLIGAVRGIQQAIRPNGNLYQAMVRPAVGAVLGGAAGQQEGGTPGSVAGAMLGAMATSPAGLSREAIWLSNPAVRGVLKQLPRDVAAWIESQMSNAANQTPPEGSSR